ncbi:hypothetical protein FYK55_15095 [Roseiconus nitratireducens]|uniref:Plant Basic Secretory Protein n=1 Tax=Roseiconus nitratireducens TaxID=2605748 RepID=A0A5M6D470_9BACT|nr:basic secretory protein-like protein [Roseiconus nitratireducens]KAA5542133.1 hypothetical protein FYK55_15095 [Roseiconus nitratireducens]
MTTRPETQSKHDSNHNMPGTSRESETNTPSRLMPTEGIWARRVAFAAAMYLVALPAAGDSKAIAETNVQVERRTPAEASPAFTFSRVPAPSATDAGNLATPMLVRGMQDRNGGRAFVLQDGALPSHQDQPDANFFLAGNAPGRLLFDFGKPIELRQINSYSWHTDSRADQRYEIFIPTGDLKPSEARETSAASTLDSRWESITVVDSRTEDASATQVGASVTSSDGGVIATTQYVLLAIKPTDAGKRFCQTFFSEIDFVDGQTHPAAPQNAPEKCIDHLVINEQFTIHFDTTEVPALRPWVQTTLMPACQKWYPRIVSSLPSKGFAPPTDFRIVFRDGMRGVAYTSGQNIYCAGDWYQANLETEATGSVVHELVHVVQQYGLAGDRRPPGWLVEGIADHIRWYQFEPPENRRRINWERADFDDAYFPSATFLDYIVQNMDPDAIRQINADCRHGRYRENYWQLRYGKSAEAIWAEARKAAQPAD